MIDELITLIALSPVLLMFLFLASKLITYGYLVTKKRFEERNSTQKEGQERWH